MLSTKVFEAPKLWHYLNGIISVYKPAGVSARRTQAAIITNLCRGN